MLALVVSIVVLARPGERPIAGPAGPSPTVAAPTPVRVVSLRIDHLPKTTEDETQKRVVLGERSFAVGPDDDVLVRAELSEPAYAYLIAFRPDGVDEICDPEEPEDRPGNAHEVRYPPAAKAKIVYRLDNGAGLQAFAVVASRNPLPPYQEWKNQHGTPPWSKGLSSPPNVVWWHDGEWLVPLTRDDPTGSRGKGAPRRGDSGPIDRLAEWLRAVPGVDAVAIKAFPVPRASRP